MPELEYYDSFDTASKQDDQPQPLMTRDRDASAVRGPLWTVKLNIRLLSVSIDALLLIIVSVLAAGSNDKTPVIAFGPLVSCHTFLFPLLANSTFHRLSSLYYGAL